MEILLSFSERGKPKRAKIIKTPTKVKIPCFPEFSAMNI
jgi:hypothetical protein